MKRDVFSKHYASFALVLPRILAFYGWFSSSYVATVCQSDGGYSGFQFATTDSLPISARESYGDNAVGYVQIKREGNICYVKGKITAEHKIRKKAYSVSVICDEKEEVVLSARCEDCTASQGGCKHAIAFLAWIHRRSEDPPRTSTECYWKRSSLAAVGSSIKCIKATELGKKTVTKLPEGDGTYLKEFVQICEQHKVANKQLTNYLLQKTEPQMLSLHLIYGGFLEAGDGPNAEAFFAYAQNKMSAEICKVVQNMTRGQAESPLWHELRYARITASKIHAAAHCNTVDGSLVETLLGAKFRGSAAMERGQRLESQVIKTLSRKLKKSIKKSGLILCREHPIFGASPDGLGEDFVVEVKCPMTDKTFKNYFNDAGEPAEKYNAQMQLQMFFANKSRAVFCVALPDFEFSNGTVEVWIHFDEHYCAHVMSQAKNFWCQAIFPRL